MVIVHRLPDGEPFAVVVDSRATARTSVAADGSAVTIVLRAPGKMPCSVILPGSVAHQIFGRDFVPTEVDEPDDDWAGTGGGV